MRKSLVLRRCEQFMRLLSELGYTEKITLTDLRYLIMRYLGGNRLTIQQYLKRLRTFGFIEPLRAGDIYKIVIASYPSPLPTQKRLNER